MTTSNTPQPDNNPDTAEAKIDKILDAIWAYGVDWTEYREKQETGDNDVATYAAKIKDDMKREMKAQLKGLLVDARIDELGRLYDPDNGIMASHYIYLIDGAADEISKELRERISALQQTRQEEVGE